MLNRKEAIEIVGTELVEKAELENCEDSCVVTDGTEWTGYRPYEAYSENDDYYVKVIYMIEEKEAEKPLDDIEWKITGYEVENI